MEIEFKDLVLAIVALVVGLIPGVITLWLGYRRYEPRVRPRSKLKTDLEILNRIDPDDTPYEYSVVKAEVREMIKQIYEKPTEKEVGKKHEEEVVKKPRRNWPLFAACCVIFVVFILWSWYLVRDGFTWWVIGTGYGALLSISWMTLSLRVLEPTYKVEPEPKERRKVTRAELHMIIRDKLPEGDIHFTSAWLEADYYLCDIDDIEVVLGLDERNHYRYVKHKYDCDNFARLLWGQFSMPGWEHFAIGLCSSDVHTMVVCVDANDDLWLIEPQTEERISQLLDWQGLKVRFIII